MMSSSAEWTQQSKDANVLACFHAFQQGQIDEKELVDSLRVLSLSSTQEPNYESQPIPFSSSRHQFMTSVKEKEYSSSTSYGSSESSSSQLMSFSREWWPQDENIIKRAYRCHCESLEEEDAVDELAEQMGLRGAAYLTDWDTGVTRLSDSVGIAVWMFLSHVYPNGIQGIWEPLGEEEEDEEEDADFVVGEELLSEDDEVDEEEDADLVVGEELLSGDDEADEEVVELG
ncbi:CHZ domain-containing protein [Balamuthia mandrillaris]